MLHNLNKILHIIFSKPRVVEFQIAAPSPAIMNSFGYKIVNIISGLYCRNLMQGPPGNDALNAIIPMRELVIFRIIQ